MSDPGQGDALRHFWRIFIFPVLLVVVLVTLVATGVIHTKNQRISDLERRVTRLEHQR